MGYAAKRDYQINWRLSQYILRYDKRPSRIADACGIRRDTFSAILGCRRPIYAEELVPICTAAGCSVAYLIGLEPEPGDAPRREP